jgi:hypothetical protein
MLFFFNFLKRRRLVLNTLKIKTKIIIKLTRNPPLEPVLRRQRIDTIVTVSSKNRSITNWYGKTIFLDFILFEAILAEEIR